MVPDLSKSLDDHFRGAYHGGIVDVYRPHLVGQGYYYDVNTLYPTAMCRPFPVGIPTLVNLTVEAFKEGQFFGYLWAWVEAPGIGTPGGSIGLLPIKHKGRLICPAGTFGGFFFSEELRFALANGYRLLNIEQAWSFKKGINTFKTLIERLNKMKVQAQLNNQPVLRNVAKLMMNSMYGRFGMHLEEGISVFATLEELNTLIAQHQVEELKEIGNLYLVTYLPKRPLGEIVEGVYKVGAHRPMQTNVPIAAAVTAYSRMIINEYKLTALEMGLELYYSDTDSLVLNGQLPPRCLDQAKLGLLKLEHEILNAYFVMPKVYWLEEPGGRVITKCKGYPGNLLKHEVLALYEGHAINLTVNRWHRSLQAQTVSIETGVTYKIDPLFIKRVKVYNAQGKWVNTSPIILP